MSVEKNDACSVPFRDGMSVDSKRRLGIKSG
jgi:hypothetical protein